MELVDYEELNVKKELFHDELVEYAVCFFNGADGNAAFFFIIS
jgi:hypothetical protein